MAGFDQFFKKATGNAPFPFQREFAKARSLPQLVNVPTGMGKTAMIVIGWLWRRYGGDGDLKAITPRRLVYCLPMRVLVDQTRQSAILWLENLDLLGGTAEFEERDGERILRSYTPDLGIPEKVNIHVLMGGEERDDWDIYPEREAILIGTQDMLLSRALNRGYAASRARWPMQFGTLHNDCLWIYDEIQLMGAGLTTTAQLEAFRDKLPDEVTEHASNEHRCLSVWMSATMRKDWLGTVDFKPHVDDLLAHELADDDLAHKRVRKRLEAEKPLKKASSAMGDAVAIAKEVLEVHKPGTRTIVVVNTVKRACELFEELNETFCDKPKKGKKSNKSVEMESETASQPGIVLLHSRFRSGDRVNQVTAALANIDSEGPGAIVVSTQVIEAGVDVSSTTLFTELAPWASLIQRFGRCNRRGEDAGSRVFWFDLPSGSAAADKMVPPYDPVDLDASRKHLNELEEVGIKSLPDVELAYEHTHVIRRKDLIDLFDTTPDLAGGDIDIDRFVREVEDSSARLFWCDWDQPKGYEPPPEDMAAPRGEELCPAPIGEFRRFVDDRKRKSMIWKWNFLDRKWERADAGRIAPGQVYLVHPDSGGYLAERGWNPGTRDRVAPIDSPIGTEGDAPDATDDDQLSHINVWQTIAEHEEEVCAELDRIVAALLLTRNEAEALRLAARWHDRGKTHFVFQNAIDDGDVIERRGEKVERRKRPETWQGCREVAKAPDRMKNADGAIADPGFWRRYDWLPGEGRRHFRHELASALAVLLLPEGLIPKEHRDLVAYLVAAHHGKVRLSIRSLPNETQPRNEEGNSHKDRRFARGIWDGDELPRTDLGGGVAASAVTLSLEPMELGLCEEPPFTGQPSWAERMLRLRDELGPFRLAYLESILRAADMRASRKKENTSP